MLVCLQPGELCRKTERCLLSLLHVVEGYKGVQYEDSPAADEPGQMFDDEGLFGALQSRKNHDDAQAIRPVAHHGQGEQCVGDALCRLSLELQHQQKNKGFYIYIYTHFKILPI